MAERLGDFDLGETRSDQLAGIVALLRASFPHASHINEAYTRWLYLQNPDGTTLSSNCVRERRVMGHVALTPLRARIQGEIDRGVIVGNVATDPSLAGRGLFTRLLEAGLELATSRGFGFAVAVPNAQSVGAFVKRTGFTALGPLDARIAIGSPPPPSAPAQLDFERTWSCRSLRWRLEHPGGHYGWHQRKGRLVVTADTGKLGIRVELASLDPAELEPLGESISLGEREMGKASGPLSRLPVHLYVGLDPRRHWRARPAINLPLRMRPAPLHLVVRDLKGTQRPFVRETTLFRAIDFDAY